MARCVCIAYLGNVWYQDALWEDSASLSLMLWAMICWETLGPAIHVDVTLTNTTYLSIGADHVHLFMEKDLSQHAKLPQPPQNIQPLLDLFTSCVVLSDQVRSSLMWTPRYLKLLTLLQAPGCTVADEVSSSS